VLALVLALSIGAQVEGLGGQDKLAHFAASLVVTDAAWATAAALDAPLWGRALLGASAGAVSGVAKELVDLAGCGTPSLGDLVYDALGVGAGVGFALAVEAILRDDDARASPAQLAGPL
jgi:hypothetical protein